MSTKVFSSASMSKFTELLDHSKKYFHYALVITLITVSCLWSNVYGLVGDDGAFFLKYAENMTKGYFWYYNIESGPIWGASAPLYPLLIAPLLKIGIPPVAAIKIVGVSLLNAAGLLGFEYFAENKASYGFIFAVLFAMNSNIVIHSTSGLETPLTMFLICLAVYEIKKYEQMIVTSVERVYSTFKIPLLIGILAINKIDLIPFSMALIIAYCLMVDGFKRKIRCIMVPTAILLSFHSFAWAYFGFPLPNSFLTKALHQNNFNKSISHDWILNDIMSTSPIALFAAVVTIVALLIEFLKIFRNSKRDRRTALVQPIFVRTGLCLSFLCFYFFFGYSAKPPFEPYLWYISPISLAICYLATLFVTSIDFKLQLKAS